jgi:beta-lactamase class D
MLAAAKKMKVCLPMSVLLIAACSATTPGGTVSKKSGNRIVDCAAHFENLDGAFVLYDQNAGSTLRHNPARCAMRLSPCSTFKIPNTLIALDTGVADNENFLIPWNKERNPVQPWWKEMNLDWARDHILSSAMRESVVWYYQELARRIGAARMEQYLSQFNYGNRDFSGGIDQFWLTSTLAISADEQVAFLRAVRDRKFGVSEHAHSTLEKILLRDAGEGWVLRAKTGGGGEKPSIGWLVGWVEANDNVYFFALNVLGEDAAEVREVRFKAAEKILKELKILPSDAVFSRR